MKNPIALIAATLILTACDGDKTGDSGDDNNSDGACQYADFEEATCMWTSTDGALALDVVGDAGTTASAGVTEDTICYSDSAFGLDEPFDCTLQELVDGGCNPDAMLVDVGGCDLEVR